MGDGMPKPPKSVAILKIEGKSHRTKAELAARERGEKATLTGVKIKKKDAVRNNIIANREFTRLQKLLAAIDKDDAIYENVLNRYCQLYAECLNFEVERDNVFKSIDEMNQTMGELIDSGDISLADFYKQRNALYSRTISLDRQIQNKRDMMLKIEKENLMTIAAALRSVPKQDPVEEDPLSGLFS